MQIYEEIRKRLQEEYNSGYTQQQIADKAGITNQHVCRLLSGKSKIEKMELETFFKLFPSSKIILQGGSALITSPKNCQNVVGINKGTITTDCLSAVMDKILADSELSSDEKIKFIKVLKK